MAFEINKLDRFASLKGLKLLKVGSLTTWKFGNLKTCTCVIFFGILGNEK